MEKNKASIKSTLREDLTIRSRRDFQEKTGKKSWNVRALDIFVILLQYLNSNFGLCCSKGSLQCKQRSCCNQSAFTKTVSFQQQRCECISLPSRKDLLESLLYRLVILNWGAPPPQHLAPVWGGKHWNKEISFVNECHEMQVSLWRGVQGLRRLRTIGMGILR